MVNRAGTDMDANTAAPDSRLSGAAIYSRAADRFAYGFVVGALIGATIYSYIEVIA